MKPHAELPSAPGELEPSITRAIRHDLAATDVSFHNETLNGEGLIIIIRASEASDLLLLRDTGKKVRLCKITVTEITIRLILTKLKKQKSGPKI